MGDGSLTDLLDVRAYDGLGPTTADGSGDDIFSLFDQVAD